MTKTRKMLSDWNAPYIQALIQEMDKLAKSELVNWALAYTEDCILPLWRKHCPEDHRPQEALAAARKWLAGEIKLPQAKPLIQACHAAARESLCQPVAQAAARAIAHTASIIHISKHCYGLPLYGALALAYDQLEVEAPWSQVEIRAAAECERMSESLRAFNRCR